ncbi:chorismate--pyruvate lyase family protein [Orrella marina]|uniref:Probable chorismate pyruvate-lyase n=1 Tax=Orrella marina TaxID=2163011 RepID=A0A2R4XHU6_9BURK|nr:chorismate lyase [Orrella marina]AWB33289.1 chorismate--pyruvate lyase [Orrella marina]
MASLIYFNRWRRQPPPVCSSLHKRWLTRPGALTAGLRTLGRFSLHVVSQGVELSRPEDNCFAPKTLTWRREVLMSIDEIPCVLARSVTILLASHGTWQGIRRLGRRPLADILYNDPGIVRSQFEISQIGRAHGLHGTVIRARPLLATSASYTLSENIETEPTLLARRSVFWRDHQPLLVSECFMPDFWSLAGSGSNEATTGE